MRRKKVKFDLTKNLASSGLKIGGGLAAKVVSKKVMPDMNPKIKSGALLGLAILTPSFVKNDMVSDLADGIAVVAGTELVGSFVPGLAGLEDDDIMAGIGYDPDDEYDLEETDDENAGDDSTVQ